MSIVALSHVTLAVRDLDAAMAAYRTMFARDPACIDTADGARYAWFQMQNTALMIASPTGTGSFGAFLHARLADAGEGLTSLAFRVNALGVTSRLLERRGIATEPALQITVAATAGAPAQIAQQTALAPDFTHGVPMLLAEGAPADGPSAASADAVSGLDHVVVQSPDPERAIALYGGRLGLDLRLDRSNPAWGTRLLFFRCGDLVVEVAHSLKEGVRAAADRLWGLSWRVANIDAARARLVAAGCDISEIRTGRRPFTRVCTVRDAAIKVPTILISWPPATPNPE